MAISVQDERLLDGKEATLEALEGLELEGEPGTIVEAARRILEESIESYRKAIRREDLTDEVRDILQEPQKKASDALVRVYYALKRQYAERRAKGEPLTEQDREVETLVRNISPGDYLTASFPGAVSALEKAANFASENLPDDVEKFSEHALDRVQETRDQLEELGDRALDAYSRVEEARDQAKSNYLAVRELVSAALRLEDRYDELNDVAPPVSDVMSPD